MLFRDYSVRGFQAHATSLRANAVSRFSVRGFQAYAPSFRANAVSRLEVFGASKHTPPDPCAAINKARAPTQRKKTERQQKSPHLAPFEPSPSTLVREFSPLHPQTSILQRVPFYSSGASRALQPPLPLYPFTLKPQTSNLNPPTHPLILKPRPSNLTPYSLHPQPSILLPKTSPPHPSILKPKTSSLNLVPQ